MKKYIFKSLLVLFAVNISFSQTTATNFTTNDCNGVSHHLFDELDNGNVVVIAWVMPCSPCATYSLPAYSAVQSFSSSHPGQVHFYMADDYANTSCTSLSSWGDNYNMSNSTFFSSTDVNMNDYGVSGMPKVVVLGGLDHHVYFNENDNKINLSGVQTAIDSALNSFVSSTSKLVSAFQLNTFPNPTQDKLTINYHFNKNEEVIFEIIDLLGKKVKTMLVFNDPGTHTTDLNISKIPSGNYILRMQTSERTENLKFTISK
ncbi:MAG: T9SS type A sorting domain-containing protein [Flavobacteriales bacterium]|nr:T9SS type A sorting domain-containing protein [Flavobacteriales bacterium]